MKLDRPKFKTKEEYQAWQEGLNYVDFFLSTQVGSVETVYEARKKFRVWCFDLKKDSKGGEENV